MIIMARYPEREIDCQMAIEDALLKILGDATPWAGRRPRF